MKRAKLFGIGIFICVFGFSQDYVPFPDSNAIWNIYHGGYYSHFKLRFGIVGDTTINEQYYSKIYRIEDDSTLNIENMTYYAALRETAEKQIFVKISDFEEDILIYDFSLSVGDTMLSNSPNGYLQWDICVIEDIDSIELENNQFRKRFKINNWGEEYWIEGIGSTNGLFHPISEYIIGTWDILRCFKHNEITIYLNNEECDQCFCSLSTSTQEIELSSIDIQIYPNPSQGKMTIKKAHNTIIYSITIYTQNNHIIQTIKLPSKTIDISNLKPGIYFAEIKTSDGDVMRKIVVH